MADPFIKLLNLAKIKAKIAKLPAVAAAAIEPKLKVEVDDLVSAQKRAAPVDEASKSPGAFRDSIHAYPNESRVLSFIVLADAKDEDGKFIGSNIEQGHRTPDGQHVAGKPSFWPTWRARKPGMKRRLSKAGRDAIKQYWET